MTDQLGQLQPGREAGLERQGEWDTSANGLVNVLPPLVSMEDLAAAKDGIGIATAVLPGFSATDVELACDLQFEPKGAAGVCFRMMQDEEGRIMAMYSVAVFANGVHLWRWYGGRWSRLTSHFRDVAANEPHALHVQARGDRIAVRLDDTLVVNARDTVLVRPGTVGVRASEGQCRFMSFRVKALD